MELLQPGDVMFIYVPIIMLVLRAWGTIKFLMVAGCGANYIYEHMWTLEVMLTFLQVSQT